MDSGPKLFEELVPGDRKFQIPRYQRDYSWSESQLDDLWRDIETVRGTDKPHFMGTVILRRANRENKEGPRGHTTYDIIDGQQRLTTLQILLNELVKRLREDDDEYSDYIRLQYIENRGFKFSLKGDDARFFEKEILGGREGVEETNIAPETDSQEKLQDSKAYFDEKFAQRRNELTKSAFVDYLYQLFETIKRLEFMAYNVESPSEAVRIFEATNDRGKQLTDLERTKSFLMYQLHLCYEEDEPELEGHLEDIRREFKQMYRDRKRASKHGSVPSLDRIQRYHFIIWDDRNINVQNPPYQRHLSELKQRFRAMDNDDEKVTAIINYVQDLRESFESLREMKETDVNDDDLAAKLDHFFALGYQANFYPLLIAAWMNQRRKTVEADDILQLLKRVETYILRAYVLRDYRTTKRKKSFYNRGRDVHDGTKTVADVIEKIEQYIDWDCPDEKIITELRNESVYKNLSALRLRYLLYFYDVSLSQRNEHLHLDFKEVVTQELNQQEISIEHVWPQDSTKLNLNKEEKEQHEVHKHRLGNLALMIGAENSAQSNDPFDKKRDWYSNSRILMLNELASPDKNPEWGNEAWDSDEWGVEQIEARENHIVNFVLNHWPNYQKDRVEEMSV